MDRTRTTRRTRVRQLNEAGEEIASPACQLMMNFYYLSRQVGS